MNVEQLKNLLGTKTPRNDVELYVDGPFASPFSDVINSRTVICIAGGIGFTPFFCVIQNLMYLTDKKHIVVININNHDAIFSLLLDGTAGMVDRIVCISFFAFKKLKAFCGHHRPSIN